MDCESDEPRSSRQATPTHGSESCGVSGQGASAPANVAREASLDKLGSGPYRFEELFGDAVVVSIQLGDKVYELRRTKSGKLVLNR